MKQGRNADNVTRDRINKQKESIKQIEKKAADYRNDVDKVVKDLELNVLFPALAHRIRPEVEMIVSERKRLAEERGEEISDEQLARLTHDIVDYLAENYKELVGVKVDDVVRHLQKGRKHGDVLAEKYHYLNDANVEVLEKLITDAYVNQFLQLDNERENIDMDVAELPHKREQLQNYERELSGLDYNLITTYEDNEKNMKELNGRITETEREIQRLTDKIATFDYDIPQIPDPQYDMLCKLPGYFKTLAAKLLAFSAWRNAVSSTPDSARTRFAMRRSLLSRSFSSSGRTGRSRAPFWENDSFISCHLLSISAAVSAGVPRTGMISSAAAR